MRKQSNPIRVEKVKGKMRKKFNEDEVRMARKPIITGNRIAAFIHLNKEIEDAQNRQVIPSPGKPPEFYKLPIEQEYTKAGYRIGMDPHEIKHIVTAAMAANNDQVMSAFKKFLMVAKMSLEVPLDETREKVRRHRKEFDDSLARFNKCMSDHTDSLEQRTSAIKEAKLAITSAWYSLVDEFYSKIAEDDWLLGLSVDDQFFIKAIINHDNKLASIKEGKVRVKWSNIKDIAPKDMLTILQNIEELRTQEAEQAQIEFLHKADYEDLISMINDSASDSVIEDIWYVLYHRALNDTLRTSNGESVDVMYIIRLGCGYQVKFAEHLAEFRFKNKLKLYD